MTSRRGAIEHVERTGGVHLQVPRATEYLSLVRMVIHSLSQRRDLDEERSEDLVLAVSEATSRVIEQGVAQGAGRGQPVELLWSETDQLCAVEVIDRHGALDLEAVPSDRVVLSDPGRAALEGDLSTLLVRTLVDDVATGTGPAGSSVRMTVLSRPWEADRP